MQDPFVLAPDEYKRDINILANYKENTALYLSIMTGCEVEKAKAWISKNQKPNEPVMRTLSARKSVDRERVKQPLTNYLREVEHTGRILGPNMIMYANPDKKMGFLPEFIDEGLKRRSKVKKLASEAKMRGDNVAATFYNNQQSTVKILNNSISGAHASPHNPIYSASAHTTLTSICRCATSYSNALVERLLASNRHYYNDEVTIADLVAAIRHADMDKIKECQRVYGLVTPTKEWLFDMVWESAKQYWRGEKGVNRIKAFINKLNDQQRMAAAYILDLKAIRDNNDAFMREFIGVFVNKPTVGVDNPKALHKNANNDLLSLVGLTVSEEINGRAVSEVAENDPAVYGLYGAAIDAVQKGQEKYQLFIDTFFKTRHMPGGIHSIPTSLRKVAVVSDTDSTIFTTEDWVVWYVGKNDFGVKGMTVAGAMAYLDGQILKHILAMLSRHMGVKNDKLFRLAMKPEFYQPVLGVTNMSKHYFSYIRAKEGEVYKTPDFDRKGVNLKNSRLPGAVSKGLENYIRWIMDTITSGQTKSCHEALEVPVRLAHDVRNRSKEGYYDYMSAMQVKPENAYKNPLSSAYAFYQLWELAFASKYGQATPPPYNGVKVPVTLGSALKMEMWIKTLDATMAEGVRTWLKLFETCSCGKETVKGTYCASCDTKVTGKASMSQIILPYECLKDGKIPKEIIPIIDVDRLESEMTSGYLIVLETLGIYLKNKDMTRLLSKEVPLSIYEGKQ